jgi:bifunctional UDP-N-acetylglucosamine pyrophosphorylase/glucosamine-1-phosphate N-acetyltransferase
MINEGIEIRAIELSKWQPVGYPWHLLELNRIILEREGPIIGSNVKLKPGACVERPVAIGDNSVIGPNCSIRKYSSIGKDCNIGNASEIKNSIIMDNTKVPHLNYVGDSVIGRDCNLAAGTVFANLRLDEKNVNMVIKGEKIDSNRRKLGCVVGDNVKFGVNVTVMPGKRIWNNLLIPPCVIIREDLEEQPEL